MKSFTFMTSLLLCSFSWISVSGSESHTLEVRTGYEVTLLCSDLATSPTWKEWFRVVNRTKPHCISSLYGSDDEVSFCDGFQNGKFEMSSNVSTVFLKIKQVELSDTGLYFCGFYMKTHTVISTATYLNVQGKTGKSNSTISLGEERYGMANIMCLILGGLTVLLTIFIIALAVKIKKLLTAVNEGEQPGGNKVNPTITNMGSDDLNYAAVHFQAKPKRNRRPASEREMETHVVYAATR
uniref:Immunoglobulin domain-containing protein n=1 Tax=Sparus aurata TaxID=8175 RepID=A0A671XVG0_SPAAU